LAALVEGREVNNFPSACFPNLVNFLTAFKFCRWVSHAEDLEAPLKVEGEMVVYDGKDLVLKIGYEAVAIPGWREVAAGTKEKSLLAKWRSFIKALS